MIYGKRIGSPRLACKQALYLIMSLPVAEGQSGEREFADRSGPALRAFLLSALLWIVIVSG
jgi:hypothetical protein